MQPREVRVDVGILQLIYASEDGRVTLTFWLNFQEERLEFDTGQSLQAEDDESVEAAQNWKELVRFMWDYFGNGELQIWNAESDELLSRCDAFIPTNIILDPDGHNAQIAAIDVLIAGRMNELP